MEKEKMKIGYTAKQVHEWYLQSVAYQTSIGLRERIPQCVRFYEGDQWATPTKDTKHFPRPVINITEMICNNKKSQVLSSPVKIVYKAEEQGESVEKFNRFSEYQVGRLRQAEKNNQACLDGAIKGSYCLYYYWDEDVVGIDGLVEGDIGLQVYDPLDVHFANPKEKDEQKQEWILLTCREDVEKVKEMADEGIGVEDITDDYSDSIYKETESETTKYVTVYTLFFRHNGEVYFQRSVEKKIFNAPRPFTPSVSKQIKEIDGIEDEDVEEKPEDRFLDKPKATLYPIMFSSWKERDKSIYGRGEVEQIIPNQKAINWNWGLQLLMAQDEAMGIIVVKKDALKGQQITNAPMQVVTDYSADGNGIRRLPSNTMSKGSSEIADKLTEITRLVTGASEVMNGELISSGMSGAAIAQLQAQALKPIEDLQKGFWRSMEKVGEILEQFFRFFYTGKKFKYEDKKTETTYSDEFNSEDYKDKHFDVVAEAVAGTVMSDVADINILDGLFAKGAISLRTYITCYPENAIANRQKLLDAIAYEEQATIGQLSSQLQEVKMQLEQAASLLTEQEATISNAKSIVDENRTLKEKLIALQAEYTQKMKTANGILAGLSQLTQEYRADATEFAHEIARHAGLMPNQQPQQNQNSSALSLE